MQQVSVVLATHNEAANLARCLDAVTAFANEIIIADGASTDDTVAIARRYKAQIIATTNKANFHINKQMAIDAARGDLILQLDADEVVDEELASFIKQLAAQPDAEIAAWWIRRRNFFCGRFLRKGGQYPDPVIRLFYRGRAQLPQKDVHEQMQVAGKTATAAGHLLHYGNPTFAAYYRKFHTYTHFKALQLQEQGRPRLLQAARHLLWLPLQTFLLIYLRHKGFVDSWQGLVFALFSGLHHPVAYLKYLRLSYAKNLS